jgi:hypothetical protein
VGRKVILGRDMRGELGGGRRRRTQEGWEFDSHAMNTVLVMERTFVARVCVYILHKDSRHSSAHLCSSLPAPRPLHF